MVFQDVTRHTTLPLEAKGLYAYLASLSDVNDECYPTVDLIRHELGISKDRYYKYMRMLVAAGVVKKVQIKTEDCKFGRNVYKLTHEVYFSENRILKSRTRKVRLRKSRLRNQRILTIKVLTIKVLTIKIINNVHLTMH